MADLRPFLDAAQRAAEATAGAGPGTRWAVDCDTDADGLCAAAVATAVLRRISHHVTVRPSRAKTAAHYDEVLDGEADAFLFLDKGSNRLDRMAEGADGRPVVVLDHHNVGAAPAGVTVLNPRLEGLDGSRDASASTTAAAWGLALVGEEALRWAPVALAGAIGDWQHRPAWQGWNEELRRRAAAAGHMRAVVRPSLAGPHLAHAIARFGWTGEAEAGTLLADLGIDADADVEDLAPEEQTRLLSALWCGHIAAGHAAAALDRLQGPVDHDVRLGTSLRHVYRTVDACGREGQPATGIAFLLGDGGAAAEAAHLSDRYRQRLREALRRLDEDGCEERRALRVAWTEDPAYTGMVAGIAMHMAPDEAPLCILARRPDGSVQVSTRALDRHVEAGIDLGRAVAAAAGRAGSEGGGHPVAAGAVVPADRVETFVAALDEALALQGGPD